MFAYEKLFGETVSSPPTTYHGAAASASDDQQKQTHASRVFFPCVNVACTSTRGA